MNSQELPEKSISADIKAGNISGQIAIGNDIQQIQNRVEKANVEVTKADLIALQQMFENLKSQVQAEAPAEQKPGALERVGELEKAVTKAKPNLTTIQYVKEWFADNLPTLTGAVTSVVVHPIVGKLVEAAGEMAAADFRKRFGGD